jgi:hypothetical protein
MKRYRKDIYQQEHETFVSSSVGYLFSRKLPGSTRPSFYRKNPEKTQFSARFLPENRIFSRFFHLDSPLSFSLSKKFPD